MTSMNVPEPVMSLAVSPVSKDSGAQVSYSFWWFFFSLHKLKGLTDVLFLVIHFSSRKLLIDFRKRILPSVSVWIQKVGRYGLFRFLTWLHIHLFCTYGLMTFRLSFLGWGSCTWIFMLNALEGSIRFTNLTTSAFFLFNLCRKCFFLYSYS